MSVAVRKSPWREAEISEPRRWDSRSWSSCLAWKAQKEGRKEGRMGRAAQHAAAAAVGKWKLAARGDTRAVILVGHGSLLEVDLS
jgi:hypothetical protein